MSALPTTRTYTIRSNGEVISRTALDAGAPTGIIFFEITVLRTWRQKRPTYQGTVVLRDGVWHAENHRGQLAGTFAEFVDAENALVTARTGKTSSQGWDGPRPARPVRPTCGVCGNELTGGHCTRQDLHWTAESLAASAARHAAAAA